MYRSTRFIITFLFLTTIAHTGCNKKSADNPPPKMEKEEEKIDPLERNKATSQKQIQAIMAAIESFADKQKERAEAPSSLEQLANFLDGGDQALIDPWGKMFQYAWLPKETFGSMYIVWTIAPDGTQIDNFGLTPFQDKQGNLSFLETAKLKAHLDTRALASAVQVSWIKNQMFPETLGEVSDLLKDSKELLINPWKQPYQYALLPAKDGETKVLIWTIAPDGTQVDNLKKP